MKRWLLVYLCPPKVKIINSFVEYIFLCTDLVLQNYYKKMEEARNFEKIIVPWGTIKKIALEKKANVKTVSDALNRPRYTELHMEIRALAMTKYDGCYLSDWKRLHKE